MTYTGQAVIFGTPERKPIIKLPQGMIGMKVRLRHESVARAYVRFNDRVEEWVIVPTGNRLGAETWELGGLMGVNFNRPPTQPS